MATNPVPDLTNKVASASVLKTLSDNLSGFSVLKSLRTQGANFNIDDLSSYPRGSSLLNYSVFSNVATGTKPFIDGHLLTFIWRNDDYIDASNFLTQIAIEDETWDIRCRYYKQATWSSWKTVSIS